MNDSTFLFNKNVYNPKKTKEEQAKEIAGLPKHIGPYEIVEKKEMEAIQKFIRQKHVILEIL